MKIEVVYYPSPALRAPSPTRGEGKSDEVWAPSPAGGESKDEKLIHLKLDVSENCTVKDAIESSGILDQCSEIDLEKNPVGIFSKKVDLSMLLKSGDRIEIYRPLIIDPMTKRRLVAKKQKN